MLKKYRLRSYNMRLVIVILITTIYGILVINSANDAYTIRQCIGLAISLVMMVGVSLIDYNWLLRFYWLFYVCNLILLLIVKSPLGHSSNNAQRWIKIGSFTFQPSEFSKILLILFTAKLIALYRDRLNDWQFLLLLAACLMIPLMFIVSQPDLSTTILIILIMLTIIFCAGLSYKIIGLALLVTVPLIVGAFVYISNPEQKLLKDYQRNRIMAFIKPEDYEDGTYQQANAVKAIGSGQLTGKGLNNDDPSSLNNGKFIPEGHTDFIFAVLGEELGFAGGCLAIFLLAWIVVECLVAAIRAKDFTGRMLCCGIAAYIAFQSSINLCVVTQIMPNTGLPLPFFSYGLTSLMTLYISMGIVLNVSLQRDVERDDEIFADDFRG